jgi:hypothetical protein
MRKKTIQKYGILPLNLLVTLEGILSRRYDLGGSGRYLLFGFVCPSCDPLRRMCCCLLPCWLLTCRVAENTVSQLTLFHSDLPLSKDPRLSTVCWTPCSSLMFSLTRPYKGRWRFISTDFSSLSRFPMRYAHEPVDHTGDW